MSADQNAGIELHNHALELLSCHVQFTTHLSNVILNSKVVLVSVLIASLGRNMFTEFFLVEYTIKLCVEDMMLPKSIIIVISSTVRYKSATYKYM